MKKNENVELKEDFLQNVTGGYCQGPLGIRINPEEAYALKKAGLINNPSVTKEEQIKYLESKGFKRSR